MNKLKFLGLLPLCTALYTTYFEWRFGHIGHALWVCNLANYLLAAAMLLGWRRVLWVSTMWVVIGSPLWIWDNLTRGEFISVHAFFVHIISAALGVYAIVRSGHVAGAVWPLAALAGLSAQGLSRLFTPAELNVNMSFAVHPQLAAYFGNYGQYFVFNLISMTLTLILVEKAMAWVVARYGGNKARQALLP